MIQDVIQLVRQVARSNFMVLVIGEGTGKEVVAQVIRQASPRRAKAFVTVDCGVIPDTLIESKLFGYERGAFTRADRLKDGYFKLAERGTHFLDEVINLSPVTRAKLLRALQERQLRPLHAAEGRQCWPSFRPPPAPPTSG